MNVYKVINAMGAAGVMCICSKENDFDREISGAIVHISTVLTERKKQGRKKKKKKKEEYRTCAVYIVFFIKAFKFPAL